MPEEEEGCDYIGVGPRGVHPRRVVEVSLIPCSDLVDFSKRCVHAGQICNLRVFLLVVSMAISILVGWTLMCAMASVVEVQRKFSQPVFISWISNCGLMLFLFRFLCRVRSTSDNDDNSVYSRIISTCEAGDVSPSALLRYSALGFISWSIFTITFYIVIPDTTCSTTTALLFTTTMFVILISEVLISDTAIILKILAALLTFSGLVLIIFGASRAREHAGSTESSILTLVCSGSFLLFLVMTKSNFGNRVIVAAQSSGSSNIYESGVVVEQEEDSLKKSVPLSLTLLHLGIIGLLNFACGILVLMFIHFIGLETFRFPVGLDWLFLSLNVVLVMTFIVILQRVTNQSSPKFVAIAGILSLPFAILFDYIFYSYTIANLALAGVSMIVTGFVVLELSHNYSSFWPDITDDAWRISVPSDDNT